MTRAGTTLDRIAGAGMTAIGLGHTSTHLVVEWLPSPHPELRAAMAEALLTVGNEVSILQVHQGLSLAMGALLMGFGVQIARTRTKVDRALHTTLAGVVCALSMTFFPTFVAVLTTGVFLVLVGAMLRPGENRLAD
ncbi:MAG: hypothetical protein KTR31_25870 [Myxococcales bacterium]|nr:hypothetical protein [Myxococcales bacterium]